MWVGALAVTFMVLSLCGMVDDSFAQAVVAHAGPDQIVASGATVTLDGSGSTPSSVTLFQVWVQTEGPIVSLSKTDIINPTFIAPTGPTTLTFEIVLKSTSDLLGAGTRDAVTITVTAPPNQPPTANAGSNQSVAPGTLVTLSGSGSDPDGDTLSYSWAKPAGSSVTLSNDMAQNPTFTAPSSTGTITFILTVSDGTDSDTDTVTITVTTNQPPTANAGRDRTFPPGSTVTLNGSGTDPDGNDADLRYTWEQTSITSETPTVTIDDISSAQTTFTAPADPTELEFTLTVFDGTSSTTDDITITIKEQTQTRNIKEMSETL
ncbi:MAG: PKD domain-containing protein, partial [Thaumarchaeota archaeon]|nr:PKD domain-containing protein [Nitrososphaerota archaeon]